MGISRKSEAEQALSSNIRSVIFETFGQVTPETALKFAAVYCLNRRRNQYSIQATIAPFQQFLPIYTVIEWSVVVIYVTYVIWILCGFTSQNH